jgi:predicted nucleic acid-binding Zn ribbon protein
MTRKEAGYLGWKASEKIHQRNKEERIKNYNLEPKKCIFCGCALPYEKRGNKFCNRKCSNIYSNQNRQKKYKYKCKNCDNFLNKKKIFCDSKCMQEFQYKTYIAEWKSGKIEGTKGSNKTLTCSSYIKRYIIEKYNNKCARCGFDKKHPVDGRSILEIDHIDGKADNNNEENLILLCPNCHALTATYRARNYGNSSRNNKETDAP